MNIKNTLSIIFLTLTLFTNQLLAGFSEKYYKIENIKVMKLEFANILYPIIEKENLNILKDRAFVKRAFKKISSLNSLNDGESARLEELKKLYKIKHGNLDEFLSKINIIPPSMALAQASVESAWGRSRFAKEANNLFGEWTWSEDGLVPKNRDKNKKHRIRIFKSIDKSIKSYMHNINSGWAYKSFRKLRAKRDFLEGVEAIRKLDKYSQEGVKYTSLLKRIIVSNRFQRFDQLFMHKNGDKIFK